MGRRKSPKVSKAESLDIRSPNFGREGLTPLIGSGKLGNPALGDQGIHDDLHVSPGKRVKRKKKSR